MIFERRSLSGNAPLFSATFVGILLAAACGAESKPTTQPDAGKGNSEAEGTASGAGDTDVEATSGPGSIVDVGGSSGGGAATDHATSADQMTTIDPDGFISVGTNDAGTFEIFCGTELCDCSDGLDNDGDGVADGFDSECTGPFDDNETTFATGIPGDNRDPKWQDCFFDGNSGAGDDGCRYHTECLTGDRPSDDASCTLTEACVDYCQPLTPPGCDCFGCCEVTAGDATVNIMLSDTCSLDNIDDEQACPRCQMTDTCANECGECELCLGKTLEDLPSSCGQTTPPPDGDPDASVPPPDQGSDGGTPPSTDNPPPSTDNPPPDGPVNVCDNGEACVLNSECGSGDYCRLGCCAPIPTAR